MPNSALNGESDMNDLDALQGVWRPVSVESDGKLVARHHFENATLMIEGSRFSLENPLPDAQQTIKGTLRINEAALPKQLILTLDDGRLIEEIYEFDHQRLTVCYPTRHGNRPSEFATAPNSGLSLVVYERIGEV